MPGLTAGLDTANWEPTARKADTPPAPPTPPPAPPAPPIATLPPPASGRERGRTPWGGGRRGGLLGEGFTIYYTVIITVHIVVRTLHLCSDSFVTY